MIPINPLAMMLGSLFLLVSVLCLCGLLVLLVAFLLRRSRRFIAKRRWWFGLLAVFLAAGSLPTMQFIRWQLDHWLERRALSPRLETSQVLGDLTLPAGTRVWMERLEPMQDLSGKPLAYGLQSVKRVEFDREPGLVLGMRVQSLDLDAGRGLAELKLLDAAKLQGWNCSPEAAVSFTYPFGAPFVLADWHLEACTLVPGSEVAGVAWPGQVSVHAVERGRWLVEAGSTPARFQGLEIRAVNLWLDGPQGDLQDWQGELAAALELGVMQYPAGTRVRQYQGNLLFSPIADAPAQDRRSGKPVEADLSVAQSAAGEVLGIYPNKDVGVIDWFKLVP